MNVSSILLATCLLGLCRCRNSRLPTDRLFIEVLDDYAEDEVVSYHLIKGTRKNRSSGQRQVWDLANGTAYEVEHTLPLALRYSDEKVEYLTVEDSRELTHSRHATTLDISSIDSSSYQFFDYSFDGNATRLVVPNKGLNFKKLVDGKRKVYTLPSGEKLEYAKLYLNKDGIAELVILVAKISDSVMEHYLELKDGVWVSCDDHEKKMRSLVSTAEFKGTLILNIEDDKDTKECTIFETELLGITTRHFYPKPGHLVKKVTDGSSELWNSSKPLNVQGVYARWNGYFDDYCLSCLIHKRGNIELLVMIVVERLSEGKEYFERVNGTWKNLTRDEFDRKIEEIKGWSIP
ncbi:signal peptide containing protein [Theileria equi strain WA]|uniref:Signal peptide containing protein n=1 Tax=Theileria equi strain WA TaxID=1537102 RepID=L1LBQ0_THEEQ|nr:signal peptide containing protein [Theileria equi strain WA]EKX72746.1 signal peptide containing protein [Theileria equi strain WA]|eukprot:XP_004832198.1 signal peptide containing protein [Theileria equi strain WA]